MYTKIEHNYTKEELEYLLELISKIKEMDFNISNELMIDNPQEEIFNIANKQIILRTNGKKYIEMSVLFSMQYIKDKNIAIVSINYEFKNNLDLIEKLLLKEI